MRALGVARAVAAHEVVAEDRERGPEAAARLARARGLGVALELQILARGLLELHRRVRVAVVARPRALEDAPRERGRAAARAQRAPRAEEEAEARERDADRVDADHEGREDARAPVPSPESKFVFEAPYLAQIGIVRADSLIGAHLDTGS